MDIAFSGSGGGGVEGQAQVGYYDMGAGAGVADQVPPIVAAGHVPVQIFNLSAAELSGIDVQFVDPEADPFFLFPVEEHLACVEMKIEAPEDAALHRWCQVDDLAGRQVQHRQVPSEPRAAVYEISIEVTGVEGLTFHEDKLVDALRQQVLCGRSTKTGRGPACFGPAGCACRQQ